NCRTNQGAWWRRSAARRAFAWAREPARGPVPTGAAAGTGTGELAGAAAVVSPRYRVDPPGDPGARTTGGAQSRRGASKDGGSETGASRGEELPADPVKGRRATAAWGRRRCRAFASSRTGFVCLLAHVATPRPVTPAV